MNTQPFAYQPIARETIYAALATLLQSVMGLQAIYRARENVANLNANISPVGLLMQATSKAVRPHDMVPTRYHDTCVFGCFVTQQSTDPNYVAATQLNNLRDLLDKALTPDMPDRSHCTLGGLIDYVRPVNDAYGEALENAVFTRFWTTLEFLYTPINLV